MGEKDAHILLVDDDPLFRRHFGARLASSDFAVVYAADGNEGREMARRLHPDLILLDLEMPVMNGIDAARRMKSESETKDIPIILLTNSDLSPEAQKIAKELGIADYLPKGLDTKEIIGRIKQVLENREP